MGELDLFGEVPALQCTKPRGRHYVRPNGYAAPPGTGPAGETCKGCVHYVRMTSNTGTKRFAKCQLYSKLWTHGRGSDILASAPACRLWQTSGVK